MDQIFVNVVENRSTTDLVNDTTALSQLSTMATSSLELASSQPLPPSLPSSLPSSPSLSSSVTSPSLSSLALSTLFSSQLPLLPTSLSSSSEISASFIISSLKPSQPAIVSLKSLSYSSSQSASQPSTTPQILLSTKVSPTQEIYLPSFAPSETNFPNSDIGWIAGPIMGGIIGLTFLYTASYLIGKYRHHGEQSGSIAGPQNLNENPASVSTGAEQIPEPVTLKNFSSYVEDLHKDGNKKFTAQFQMLLKLTPTHERSVAELPHNRNKNRFANILPYDKSRVKLLPMDVDQQSADYINASYIPGQTSQREYIAAQGPLPTTVGDFWRMIWEQNVSSIVMLTNLKEDRKDKCAKYWPSKSDAYQDEFLSYEEVQVKLTSESILSHYTVRMLQAQMDDVCRTIRQYHFLDWEDNKSPSDVEIFLNFTRDIRAWSNRNSPILVHCSSGAGRSGTFILVDRMLQVIDGGGKLDLFRTILELRDHRVSMVQNEDQFIFAHDATRRAVDEKTFGASHFMGFDGFDEIP